MNTYVMQGLTDPGKTRDNNEDAYAAVPDLGFAVVADGMGGHQAGEVASAMAVDVITRSLAERLPSASSRRAKGMRVQNIVRRAVEMANSAVHEAANTHPQYAGMGSTVVVAAFHGDRVCLAHVGDSRIYRLRAGSLQQLTEDHSLVRDLVRRGLLSPEEARASPHRNVVTRALGVTGDVQVEVHDERIQDGDVFLLCSDGLHDMLSDEAIAAALGADMGDISRVASRLIDAANEAGGEDNITVVLVHVQKRLARARKRDEQAAA